MNVFFTNECPIQSANEHCHVLRNKMIIEHTQLLSTALRMLDGEQCRVYVKRVTKKRLDCGKVIKVVRLKLRTWYALPSDTFIKRMGLTILDSYDVYADTHHNHPSAVWVRKSYDHYVWLWECTKQLCALYTHGDGKVHKTESILDLLAVTPANIPEHGFTNPPVAAPDEFKALAVFGDTCKAYQEYLCSKFEEWQSRAKPIKVEFDVVPDWYCVN
ncbi:putative DNA binding protein [Vibrio phage 381E49-1]|nr:putative DNA binding protein [Vibrio phage 381E49-1]